MALPNHLSRWLERAALVGLLLVFWGVASGHLDATPLAHEDESWQTSTAWKLATEGVFGSDMFAGFYNMDRHYYGYMPAHGALMGIVFRLAGLGLFQARLLSVFLALLTLSLTFQLGRRMGGSRVALLAVLLLIFLRMNGGDATRLSGILLLDVSRIARYDSLVPVFGLAAFLTYLVGRERQDARLYAVAGTLAGLSGLSHLHGLFWFAAIGLLALADRVDYRLLVLLVLGFLLPWGLYVGYVLAHPADWIGQTRNYADRFALWPPGWFLENFLQEPRRYNLGLRAGLLRPGLWFWLVGLPASSVYLARRALRARGGQARTLLIPLLVLPVLFALLIRYKTVSYLVTLVPLFAVALSMGVCALWRWSRAKQGGVALRLLLALAIVAVTVEGTQRLRVYAATAAGTTRYPDFVDAVRAETAPGAPVLVLHRYWIGLEDLDVRSWAVPIFRSSPTYSADPVPIEEALDDIQPGSVLLDARMLAYLSAAERGDPTATAIIDWLAARGFRMTHVVDDPGGYGRMEIWERAPS